MFITIGDGLRINLNLVKHITFDDPEDADTITCSFEFIDGTMRSGSISAQTLAQIDLTFSSPRG